MPRALFHGAGKWLTALITTCAALAALLVNAQNLGLGAWLGAHGLGFADYAASRVIVTPRVDSLFSVGDTVLLSATVTDRRGASLVGSSLTWRSEDSLVVTVDSSGAVVARGPGTTLVVATVRRLSAGVRVTVSQRVAAVAIAGDTLVRVPEGESVPLVAVAVDARGVHVRDRPPAWSSSDSAIASVDPSGLVTGHVPGHALLSAAADGHLARARIEVVLAPARLMLEAGDAQRVPAGRRVPQPIVVRVLSRGGRPVPRVAVSFRTDDPDATLAPPVDTSDRLGRVRTVWTLSPRPGRQRLAASVDGVDSALIVAVEADPVTRNTRIALQGDAPAGPVGRSLAGPVVARVTDSLGAALADVPVVWAALDGGRLDPIADRTDSAGEARARWTLGPGAGRQRAELRVGNPRTMPPFVIAARAIPGDPLRLQLASSVATAGPVAAPLPNDVILLVKDQYGNPVPGVRIDLRPRDGSVADSAPVTDSTGHVTVRWTLGRKAGTDLLRLRARGVDSLVTVVARARPASPANLAFARPPETAPPGRALTLPIVVTDPYGNPVPDVVVVFTVSAGTLAAGRAMSDQRGQAGARWTPGARPSQQTITATVRSTTLKAALTLRIASGTHRPESR